MRQYQILHNRPIDQWKVTELKEELKRRQLTTKGLKDDLIKRLDEALRIERENAASLEAERETAEEDKSTLEDAERENSVKDANNDINLESLPVDSLNNVEELVVHNQTTEDVVGDGDKNVKVDDVVAEIDINESLKTMGDDKPEEGVPAGSINSSVVQHEVTITATSEQTSVTLTETSVSEVAVSGQDTNKIGTPEEIAHSNTQLDDNNSDPKLESGDVKPQGQDVKLDPSAPDKQVSEVNPTLGSQVISSISTDSVSNNEKIELKENKIADNVKLELDIVKAEMVEQSSSNVVPDDGDSHPMDVEEPQEKASTEAKDEGNDTGADMSMKNDTVDLGYTEKLNLDRSSGDDFIEEDHKESKHITSKGNFDEVKKVNVKKVDLVEEEIPVDVVEVDLPKDQRENPNENKVSQAAPSEKRKLNEAGGTTEPLKRQRRWNAESLKAPELRSPIVAPNTTPKDASRSNSFRRNLSLSEAKTSEDVPKERVVPPAQNPPTNSLRIDRFVRPFTLKAVQELLGKTGSVTSFWMDQIKTHCYVTYSSVEEAVESRNAVYNLQWPANGGRLLVAEFVDPQEVKMRVDGPSLRPAPVTPAAASTMPAQPSPRQQLSRQQLPPPPPLPQPPPLSNLQSSKERLAPPPPPAPQEKHDPPIVTLDDLFRKTKTTPRIYYLPLTDEQVEAKRAERAKNNQ